MDLPRVPDVGYPTPGSFGTWGREHDLSIVTLELPDAPREGMVRTYAPVVFELLTGSGA